MEPHVSRRLLETPFELARDKALCSVLTGRLAPSGTGLFAFASALNLGKVVPSGTDLPEFANALNLDALAFSSPVPAAGMVLPPKNDLMAWKFRYTRVVIERKSLIIWYNKQEILRPRN